MRLLLSLSLLLLSACASAPATDSRSAGGSDLTFYGRLDVAVESVWGD